MTADDRAAPEALNSRFDHTAAIARLACQHANLPTDLHDAIGCIAATLGELGARMDRILNPEGVAQRAKNKARSSLARVAEHLSALALIMSDALHAVPTTRLQPMPPTGWRIWPKSWPTAC